MTRNKEYWIARALQRENEAYLRGVGLTAKMFQEYDRAAKAIRRDIGDFYSKYAGKYGLTYDQAVRLLTRKEFQEWKATLGEYITRIAAEPDPRVKALLTAQLDALSTNSRISRLEALLGQIDLKLNELWETGVSQMKAEFGETFREGYYKKVYDIQSRAGFIHEFAKLDESVVENVLSYPWSGAMFSDRLWRNKQALLFHVRETITQGVMQGKSVATMSKELSAKMGQSYKAAERLIRTETTHFHSEADKAAYNAAGVDQYEYMALIPNQSSVTIGQAVEVTPAAEHPTRTYKADFETGRVAGFVDETEAMKQAIIKILMTERFSYLIYSWDYGTELNAVVGKSYHVFSSEIKRVITEALLADSRITGVTDFKVWQIDKRTARVSFTAETIFGEIPVERTVTTNV